MVAGDPTAVPVKTLNLRPTQDIDGNQVQGYLYPLAPMMLSTDPGDTSSVMPRSTSESPNDLRKSFTWMIGRTASTNNSPTPFDGQRPCDNLHRVAPALLQVEVDQRPVFAALLS